jgi:hypothetical protein
MSTVGYGSIFPGSVTVEFPAMTRGSAGCGPPGLYEVVVTIAQAVTVDGQTPESPYASHSGTHRVRSTATAVFDEADDEHPANRVALEALALRIARDYYGWRLGLRDETYPGTVAYAPDGTADLIVWSFPQDGIETRVTAPTYDCEPIDLLHGLPCVGGSSGESSEPGGCGGPLEDDFGLGDSVVWVWYPPGGIKAATHAGRVVTPQGASCEVMREGPNGTLCPSGVERAVWNYWSGRVSGDRLGMAKCWRGRLVAALEDCVIESSS